MRLFSTEAKVGIVVLAAIGLLTVLTFQVGKFSISERGYTIEAVFPNVSGLEEKAKVRLTGVHVGSVERIFLKDGKAHAVLRLKEGTVVRADSVVRIAAIGILSEFYVEISAGSLDAPALAPGAVVAGEGMMDINQMVAQLARVSTTIEELARSVGATFAGEDSSLARLLDNAGALVASLTETVEHNRERIAATLGDASALARETRELSREMRAFLGENREQLGGTVENLRAFSATLNRRADELASEISRTAEELRTAVSGGRGDLEATLASLRAASAKADRAAASLESVMKKIDGGQGTIGRLVNDPAPLERVDRAVGQVGGIAEKINRGQGTIGRLVNDDALVGSVESAVGSVNRLLGGADRMQFYLGFRSEFLAEAEEFKSFATVKLQPRPDKYYLLELVDDPVGKRSITRTSTEIVRPEGGYTLEERTVVDEISKLDVTAQFAKSFGPLTLRGGLIESQGGVALDYEPFGGALRLSMEGWDFGREEGAQLKFSGRLRLFRDAYLVAGVDDWLVDDKRTLFLGAGILFSDEDLKYIISLGSLSP